jgi:RND family efflux transporter MFP subunit
MNRWAGPSLAACALLCLPPVGQTAEAPKAPPAPVEVAEAQQATVTPHTWIPGSIVSRNDARIAGVVAGRVLEIAEVGQRVAAGTRLARLDDTIVRLRVADLQAQLARARAQAALAKAQADRFSQLLTTHVLSVSQVDEARAQSDMAREDVARITAQLRQAEYETAQSEIRAPFAGVVTERFVQRGEYVNVGAAVVRLVDTQTVEARATAALALASGVKPGQAVSVRARGEEQMGTIRTLVPVGDDRSRQFEVRVLLEHPGWLVGTAVDVSLPAGATKLAVVVPRDAIVLRNRGAYLFRVTRTNTVEELAVEPGASVAGMVEVAGAVVAGDRVVVRGGERLQPGQPIAVLTRSSKVVKPGSPPG